jgi:hypothetical protein|tara:strand:- start:3621 stop:3833 length:213 start_codon:yes stop_codon:yes gene_type:complete
LNEVSFDCLFFFSFKGQSFWEIKFTSITSFSLAIVFLRECVCDTLQEEEEEEQQEEAKMRKKNPHPQRAG